MPGWELIGNKEKKAINDLFKFPKVGIKKPIFYNNLKVNLQNM